MASLIFWTTIVNPKGFVIGLALIPQGGDAMQKLFAFTVFAMLIVAFASLWCWSGSMFTVTTRGNTRLLRQLASIALCCLSLMLVSFGMRMIA
jgi:threonine/homoserine/homoserine lactone efflux protein